MKIDVAGRVDKVEHIIDTLMAIGHRDGRRLDRDAPLTLNIHAVEQLILEFTLRYRTRQKHDAVGQRALAVVDMGDYRKISYMLCTH